MNRSIFFAVILLMAPAIMFAQKITPLKKIIELKIPREGGANGAGVAWHPLQKKYYAAMAGNIVFPLGVFDINGKRLSTIEQETMFDIRGIWYNSTAKAIQMNGYNDFGWGQYKLDAKGMPQDSVIVLKEGKNQPGEQAVGAYNDKDKVLYFLAEDGNVEIYDFKEGIFKETIELHLGMMDNDADESDNYEVLLDYNGNALVYTGLKGMEFALLNHINKEIELYDKATGYLTKKLSLPETAVAYEFLNFSYCNGIYWLFDKESRIWKGYK